MRLFRLTVGMVLAGSSLGAAAPALAQTATESVERSSGQGRIELGTMFGGHIYAA